MDIKDIKNVLMEKIASFAGRLGKKKAETVQTDKLHETENTAQSSLPPTTPAPANGEKSKKLKALTLAAVLVIFFVIGGVLAYNFYFFYEKDTPSQLTLSRPYQQAPNIPTVVTGNPSPVKEDAQDKQAQGEQSNAATAQQDAKQAAHQGEQASSGSQRLAKKAASVRVSEHDPFKSEFEKKYQTALKKERGSSSSLTELEGAIKESKMAAPPMPPPPPPPPPVKQLKLAVYGTVVSMKDTYAITDMGIVRVGNVVESFVVESINFDMVTLRQADNKDEVRNIFVKPDRSRQGSSPIIGGGQQWPSTNQ